MKRVIVKNDMIRTDKHRFANKRDSNENDGSECIVFCKKVTPNIFNIKDGFAVLPGAADCYNDGVCMISHSMNVVFVFDQDGQEK